MRTIINMANDFIEKHGLTLFVTLITVGILLIFTIISWFQPNIYIVISNNHVFEAIVLMCLAEIILLLTQKSKDDDAYKTLTDKDAHDLILETCTRIPIRKVEVLSAGLHSRQFLITELLKRGINIIASAQDPIAAIDKRDKDRLKQAVDWITKNSGLQITHFTLRLHKSTSSLRAIIIHEAETNTKHMYLGWYTYLNKNSEIEGAPNPTIYFSSRTKYGAQIYKWLDELIVKDEHDSEYVNIRDWL